MNLLRDSRRYLFFTGKGGVGSFNSAPSRNNLDFAISFHDNYMHIDVGAYDAHLPRFARCDRSHIECSPRVEMEALQTGLLQCVLSQMCVSEVTGQRLCGRFRCFHL